MHESEKWKWSHSVVSDSSRPHGLQSTRLLHPWDFLGKSTGVGCHRRLRKCSLGISNFLEEISIFAILLFSSIFLHWSLRKDFSSLLAILWNSAFRWVYLSFSFSFSYFLSIFYGNPMEYTVHGFLQARKLEWVTFPFSRGSFKPRDWTQVCHIADRFFTSWATGKPKNTGVGSLSADLSNPGIELGSPALQVDSLPTELSGKPENTLVISYLYIFNKFDGYSVLFYHFLLITVCPRRFQISRKGHGFWSYSGPTLHSGATPERGNCKHGHARAFFQDADFFCIFMWQKELEVSLKMEDWSHSSGSTIITWPLPRVPTYHLLVVRNSTYKLWEHKHSDHST